MTEQAQQTLQNMCLRYVLRGGSDEATFLLDVIEVASAFNTPVFEAIKFCKDFIKQEAQGRQERCTT